jgi:hypothetical protein
MMLFATLTAFMISDSNRPAWFTGVLVLAVYLIAITLYLLPPQAKGSTIGELRRADPEDGPHDTAGTRTSRLVAPIADGRLTRSRSLAAINVPVR